MRSMPPPRISRLGCLALAVSIALTCHGQIRPEEAGAKPLEQALHLAKAHRYSEAAAAIRNVPLPDNRQRRVAFLRLRASIQSGLGHPAVAATDMESAAQLAPQDEDLQIAAKFARLEAQLHSHASPALTLQSLRSFALTADSRLVIEMRLAEMLGAANLYSEAAIDLEEARRLAPGRADILFDLAVARYRNGDWEAALSSAEHAKTVQDSGSVEALLGDIQERRGDALAAAHSYQAAVALEPNVEEHHLLLAKELLKHQTFDAAIVVLEQARELFPESVRVHTLLGLAYYFVDRSADAVRTLLAATKINPADELAAKYLGEIALQDSDAPNPAAVAQTCAFADSHPQSKTATAICGAILLRVAEDSDDISRRPEILRRLEYAVRIAPKGPLGRCQLGKALEWSEQLRQARFQFEKCVELDPESPEGHYRLARVYRQMGLLKLANQQTVLQQQAAQRQSAESARRAETIMRFLVLFEQN